MVKFVPVKVGICESLVFQWSQFLRFFERGGVILQGTELVVTAILSFTSGGFHISTTNSHPASAGTSVLVCGQSMVILTFFEPRPSKTGRGEGGLLCVRN